MSKPAKCASWRHLLSHDELKRSSHVSCVVGDSLYIFGGELVARQPRDNKTFVVDLVAQDPILRTLTTTPAPSPRVGSAATTIESKFYLFSGRGGTAMTPIDERGSIWEFDTESSAWASIEPADPTQPVPLPRSYHCATSDGKSTIFIHAGCPETDRLSDLWAFNLQTRAWSKLANAPAPARGGASIVYASGSLYRMNGFDGKAEQGGQIDVFNIAQNEWSSIPFTADGVEGPEPRSVSALLLLKFGDKEILLTLFGERDPSALGHAGAGKMLNGFWLCDPITGRWWKGKTANSDAPTPRGWFAAATWKDAILLVGGLGETNERLDDIWKLSVD